MTEEYDIKTQQKIKKIYSRIVIIAGTIMGFAMCIYFFTYGTLIDYGYDLLLWFEFITTVLFVFGERDNLVGDPRAARALVQDVPNVRVETLGAGHLMAAEMPEACNQLLLDFFGV